MTNTQIVKAGAICSAYAKVALMSHTEHGSNLHVRVNIETGEAHLESSPKGVDPIEVDGFVIVGSIPIDARMVALLHEMIVNERNKTMAEIAAEHK